MTKILNFAAICNKKRFSEWAHKWYIKENIDHINWQDVKIAFLEKCAHKNVSFTNSDDFFQPKRIKQVQITWDKRLKHQLPKTFIIEAPAIIRDLETFLYELFD